MNTTNKVKKKIIDAFLEILAKKEARYITVNEVVELAKVSRAAFYKNYSCLDDIVMDFYCNVLDQSSPEKTLSEILKYKNEFSLLARNNYIYLLNRGLQELRIRPSFYEISYLGFFMSVINAWILDDYRKTVNEVLMILEKAQLIKECEIQIQSKTQPVLSVKTQRDSDSACIEKGIPSKELMFRAGQAVFGAYDWDGKVAIVCGKGNNAGDGYVLASLLKDNNIEVTIMRIDDSLTEDGEYYLNICKEKGIEIFFIDGLETFDDYDIIVDCIFGTGFKGKAREPHRAIINNINESKKRVVSVDINSGLEGDTGFCITAVKSNLTVSIGSLKPGLFLAFAKDMVGNLVNADIGIKPLRVDYKLFGNDLAKKCLFKRENFSNKGNYGYVALIGGCQKYKGAIQMAAEACSLSGCGVATAVIPYSIKNAVFANEVTNLTYKEDGICSSIDKRMKPLIKKYKTIAIGMGCDLTMKTILAVNFLIKNFKGKLVIDADGINALAKLDLSILENSKAKIILTPHIMEFSRLSGLGVDEILMDSIGTAKDFASKHKVILLLKGPTTLITNGTDTYLVDRGCPGMATAGSGDVLSGIISSIVSYNDDILKAVATSAYVNGIAGELAQRQKSDITMRASDTLNNIHNAIDLIRHN